MRSKPSDVIQAAKGGEMVILHNQHDEGSRRFVADNPDAKVLDWYNEVDLQEWVRLGGTLQVSSFPSVLFFVDEYEETIEDPEEGDVRIRRPAHFEVVREPETLQEAGTIKEALETMVLLTELEKGL